MPDQFEPLRARMLDLDAALSARDAEKCASFYHKDGVMVFAGRTAIYGKETLITAFKNYFDRFGANLKTTCTNENWAGAGDFVIYTADYVTTSEKIPRASGKDTQIWKYIDGEYYIFHDEFTVDSA